MKNALIILLIFFLAICSKIEANNFYYILNEEHLNNIYDIAFREFENSDIIVLKNPMGVILRYKIDLNDYTKKHLDNKILFRLKKIEYFLAKIKNPAIIEVHIDKNSIKGIKSWELSTVIANQTESILIKMGNGRIKNRINSVGYGEFLPAKNTSNNGVKFSDRVDIIILCNISGE